MRSSGDNLIQVEYEIVRR